MMHKIFYDKFISRLYMFLAHSGGQNCIIQPLVLSHLYILVILVILDHSLVSV